MYSSIGMVNGQKCRGCRQNVLNATRSALDVRQMFWMLPELYILDVPQMFWMLPELYILDVTQMFWMLPELYILDVTQKRIKCYQ